MQYLLYSLLEILFTQRLSQNFNPQYVSIDELTLAFLPRIIFQLITQTQYPNIILLLTDNSKFIIFLILLYSNILLFPFFGDKKEELSRDDHKLNICY